MLKLSEAAQTIKKAYGEGIPPQEVDLGEISAQKRAYATSAVFAEMILDHTVEYRKQFPPFGLVKKIEERDAVQSTFGLWVDPSRPVDELASMHELQQSVSTTMIHAQADFYQVKSENDPVFQPWHDDLESTLRHIYNNTKEEWVPYRPPASFIAGGFGTAVMSNVRTLDLVDKAHAIHAPDASDDEIVASALRARTIPHKIAHTIPLGRLGQALNSLGSRAWQDMFPAASFDVERFLISPTKKNPNVLDIKFNDQSLAEVPYPHKDLSSIPVTTEHIGCPALTRFETGTDHAIYRLYGELVDAAVKLDLWRSEKPLPASHYF